MYASADDGFATDMTGADAVVQLPPGHDLAGKDIGLVWDGRWWRPLIQGPSRDPDPRYVGRPSYVATFGFGFPSGKLVVMTEPLTDPQVIKFLAAQKIGRGPCGVFHSHGACPRNVIPTKVLPGFDPKQVPAMFERSGVKNNSPHQQEKGKRMNTKVVVRTPVRCDECGTVSDKMKRCSRCRKAHYCSRACQKSAWKKKHKYECQS